MASPVPVDVVEPGQGLLAGRLEELVDGEGGDAVHHGHLGHTCAEDGSVGTQRADIVRGIANPPEAGVAAE